MKWEKTADHHHDQSTIIVLIAVDRHRQICQNHCLIIIIWKKKGERERENAVMITEWADPHGHSHLPFLFSLLFSRAPHCQRKQKRERERAALFALYSSVDFLTFSPTAEERARATVDYYGVCCFLIRTDWTGEPQRQRKEKAKT